MTNGNPTDTNQASELYELCKEVYERTGWGDMQNRSHTWTKINEKNKPQSLCPLYTSDYLLEKLKPFGVFVYTFNDNWRTRTTGNNWKMREADTPLKSLLKLTIALHEAGVKL